MSDQEQAFGGVSEGKQGVSGAAENPGGASPCVPENDEKVASDRSAAALGDVFHPPIRTRQYPLSELPRCLECGGYLGVVFHVLDFHLGVVNPRGAQHVAGLALAHRFPLKLAEIFSAEPPPVNVTDDPRIDERAYLCSSCFAGTDWPRILELLQRRDGKS